MKEYRVTLAPEERAELQQMLSRGKAAASKRAHARVLKRAHARVLKRAHARVLLKADESAGGPGWPDVRIVEALGVGKNTVCRVRQRFVEQGLGAALVRKPTARSYARKLGGRGEAHLIALACSTPPDGRTHCTLRLLTDRFVELGVSPPVSDETVRRTLKQTSSSRG